MILIIKNGIGQFLLAKRVDEFDRSDHPCPRFEKPNLIDYPHHVLLSPTQHNPQHQHGEIAFEPGKIFLLRLILYWFEFE